MKFHIKYKVLSLLVFGIAGVGLYGIRYLQKEHEQREEQIANRHNTIESYVQNVKSTTDLAIKAQTKQIQSLEQKLSSLALSVKTGSTDSDQAQELLKLILSTHHDLDVVIQALVAEQLISGNSNIFAWIADLERLSPQDKLNFQRMLDKRTNWKDVLDCIDEQLKKNQPIVLWSVAERLGIRVENADSAQNLFLEQLKQQVQQHNYNAACQRMLELPSEDPIAQKLEDVCLADSFVTQYWKSLSD
jgi:hypothetical protein